MSEAVAGPGVEAADRTERASPWPADTDIALAFRALGDPTRLAIFEAVREASIDDPASVRDLARNVSAIAGRFDLSLSTVSHHLKELRTAGLIRCERRGRHVFCSVNPATLAEIERFIAPGVRR